MAQNDLELEEEGTAGKFERFLFLMIPIIFTIVLLGVLLTMLNADVRSNVLELANKIPIVKNWVPDPPADPEREARQQSEEQAESSEATINELKAQLAEQAGLVQQANEEKEALQHLIAALENEVQLLEEQQAAALETAAANEGYNEQISDMAKLYASMKPSKAVPILENLTNEELVQIFSAMNNSARTAILERMNPEKAAEVTVKLKENVTSTDMAIAALQSRLNEMSASEGGGTTSARLDNQQLSQTFASMAAAPAAELLSQMYATNPAQVITVLGAVPDATRSSILAEITKLDKARAAQILNRLMNGQ